MLMTELVLPPETISVCDVASDFIGWSQIFQTPFVATVEISGPAKRPRLFAMTRPALAGTRAPHSKHGVILKQRLQFCQNPRGCNCAKHGETILAVSFLVQK
jgi:hypothetical protein